MLHEMNLVNILDEPKTLVIMISLTFYTWILLVICTFFS